MNVLVCFYVKNEILAEYLLLQEVEHLQKFFELIDIFNLLSLILQAISENIGNPVLIPSQNSLNPLPMKLKSET